MFCPKCGKSDQTPDSYCRSCGEFLTDFSAKAYLLNKLLGGSAPRTQVRVSLVINAVTFFVSAFLLGLLMGHYDAQHEKTGQSPPTIIYLVYVYLGLVTSWQTLGFFINWRLRAKFGAGEKAGATQDAGPGPGGDAPSSRPTQRSLRPGDPAAVSVEDFTQQTTRNLDEVPRRRPPTSRDRR